MGVWQIAAQVVPSWYSLSLLALGPVCGLPVIGDTDDAPPRTSAKRERKCDISIA